MTKSNNDSTHKRKRPSESTVGYDGRNPLLREEGLFSYKDHPSKGVEEGAQRALKAVFEALGLEQEQAPQKQKDWLTRELRNVVGRYEAERRYRDAPSPEHYRKAIRSVRDAAQALKDQIEKTPGRDLALLIDALRRSSTLVVHDGERQMKGFDGLIYALSDLIKHCSVERAIAGQRGKREHLHLKVAVPLLLQIWADFRREKVSKNTESVGGQFTSPSSRFVHQVLIAVDSDLKRRFGAIENAIESTPLATFKRIKPRQVPCLSEIGSDCGTEITDKPVGEFGGTTS